MHNGKDKLFLFFYLAYIKYTFCCSLGFIIKKVTL